MFFRIVYKSGPIFLPFCHNARVWQTDRRTDRNHITIPRLHYMQHGKNEVGPTPHHGKTKKCENPYQLVRLLAKLRRIVCLG